MKKQYSFAIISAVVGVMIVGILLSTVEAEKPIPAIVLELKTSLNAGTIVCPNGSEVVTTVGSLTYTEHIGEFLGGNFRMSDTTFTHPPDPKEFAGSLLNGDVDSDKFRLLGTGFADAELADFCNEIAPEKTKFVVWGKCGEDVLVRFESDLGYSGSYTATAFCI